MVKCLYKIHPCISSGIPDFFLSKVHVVDLKAFPSLMGYVNPLVNSGSIPGPTPTWLYPLNIKWEVPRMAFPHLMSKSPGSPWCIGASAPLQVTSIRLSLTPSVRMSPLICISNLILLLNLVVTQVNISRRFEVPTYIHYLLAHNLSRLSKLVTGRRSITLQGPSRPFTQTDCVSKVAVNHGNS